MKLLIDTGSEIELNAAQKSEIQYSDRYIDHLTISAWYSR